MDTMMVAVGVVVTTVASVTLATAAFVWSRREKHDDITNKDEKQKNHENDEFEEINNHLQNDLKKHILEKINDVKGDVKLKKIQMNQRVEGLLKEKEDEINQRKTEFMKEKEAIETKYKHKVDAMTAELETEIGEMKESIRSLRIILASSTEDVERMMSTRSELECPVCLEEMRPPRRIWQCSDGHAVCEFCRKKPAVTCCPTCRKYIVGRSTIAEKLARSLWGQEEGVREERQEEGRITLTGYREVKIESEML